MSWTSEDGQHEGAVRILDILGIATVEGLDEIADGAGGYDPSKLYLRAVCSCGWHEDTPGTLDTHPLLLRTDGTVDVAASEHGPRREWAGHAGEPLSTVLRALPDLRSMPTLDRLAAIHRVELAIADEKDRAVIDARRERVTWDAIGGALGISKQSASERWGPVAPKRPAG